MPLCRWPARMARRVLARYSTRFTSEISQVLTREASITVRPHVFFHGPADDRSSRILIVGRLVPSFFPMENGMREAQASIYVGIDASKDKL